MRSYHGWLSLTNNNKNKVSQTVKWNDSAKSTSSVKMVKINYRTRIMFSYFQILISFLSFLKFNIRFLEMVLAIRDEIENFQTPY